MEKTPIGVSLIALAAFIAVLALGAGPGQAEPPGQTAPEPPAAPLLRLETGMHTAGIRRLGLDAANRYVVTGSDDKTIRVWDLATGRLLRTLRPPIWPDDTGKIYAVALSPDGTTVAAGGLTAPAGAARAIYLFDRASGQLVRRLGGLPAAILHLAFSPDGQFLVATLWGTHGLRVYHLPEAIEVAQDAAYDGASYGAAFDATGRLATTAFDGLVRLYDQAFHLRATRRMVEGSRPYGLAWTPDGTRLAVGFEDVPRVAVLAGADLAPLETPETAGVTHGNFVSVAWAADGQTLYAGGTYHGQGAEVIRRWAAGGAGGGTDLPVAHNIILDLRPLAAGGVVVGAYDPLWGVLEAPGQPWHVVQGPTTADFRDNQDGFRVAPDGASVQFSYTQFGQTPARFALRDRLLSRAPAPDSTLTAPVTTTPGLTLTGWFNTPTPQLNGTPLRLNPDETSRSVALTPDGQQVLLGTEWYLRLFDRTGRERWHRPVPGIAWSVNIPSSGQLTVAALGDGTLRWYRLQDGQELLALFPHPDQQRWILWTPSGYYDAAPGAEALLGWHVNQGLAQAADFFPVSQFRATAYRPDVVATILETRDEADALRQANAAAPRRQEAVPLPQRLPPVVQILAPQDGATVSTPALTVRFSLRTPSGEPVTAIKGLVDGRPVAQTRGLQVAAPREEATRELQLTVPMRDCEVTIIAENRYAASVPATVRLHWQGAPDPDAFVVTPTLYVLAIGVSRYQNPSLTLGFPAKDAQDFTAALRRQQGTLYRAIAVRLLTDAAAHREAILDGLEWLQRQTTSKDVAVIFVAGHGTNDPNGYYYFLPANIDLERLKSTGVAFTEFKNTVAALAGKVLFFLDTCHSGNVMQQEKRRAVLDIAGVINELASAENGAIVFAASTGNQYSLENPAWSNGAFTKALVEGLQGQADYRRSGRITVNMLDLYLSERVKELTGGRQTPTTTKPPSTPDFPVALVP